MKIGSLCCNIFWCAPVTAGQLVHRTQDERTNSACLLVSMSLWLSFVFSISCFLFSAWILGFAFPDSSSFRCDGNEVHPCTLRNDKNVRNVGLALLCISLLTFGLACFTLARISIRTNDNVRKKNNISSEKKTLTSYLCCHWNQYQAFVEEGICDETYELCSATALKNKCQT